jgi:hypothetical protein
VLGGPRGLDYGWSLPVRERFDQLSSGVQIGFVRTHYFNRISLRLWIGFEHGHLTSTDLRNGGNITSVYAEDV